MHCVAGPTVSMVAISMRLPISLPRPVARPSMAFFMGSERYTRSAAVVASSCAFSREASVDHSLNQLDSSRTSPIARSTSRSMTSSMFPRRHSSATSAL